MLKLLSIVPCLPSLFPPPSLQGGGQETTLMTAVTQLAHHGMVYVSSGFAAGPGMFDVEVARGGSAWGAGTLAGPTGARQPSEIELLQALTAVSGRAMRPSVHACMRHWRGPLISALGHFYLHMLDTPWAH